jgi:rhodanese-related sulfurtransferase
MTRLPPILSVPLGALLVSVVASGIGLAVNAARPGGIPVVAPFPYQQDCPEKLEVPEGPTVTAGQAAGLQGAAGVLFVDARPAEVFAAGHIDGARSIPFSFITPPGPETAAKLKKHEHLIVYCDSPGDKLAGLLAAKLRDLGLTRVKVLRGGWEAFSRLKKKKGVGR